MYFLEVSNYAATTDYEQDSYVLVLAALLCLSLMGNDLFVCLIAICIMDTVFKFGQFLSAIFLQNSKSELAKLDALANSRK